MYFFIIETSGEESFVALFRAERLIKVYPLSDKNQSKELLPSIQELLKRHRLTLGDLSFIAIGRGPGSFTGTRIGVMIAKALSFAQSIPLVPFCSLERFALTRDSHFAIITDARSHGFYLLQGEKEKEKVAFHNQPQLIKNKELFTLLTDTSQVPKKKTYSLSFKPLDELPEKTLIDFSKKTFWMHRETARAQTDRPSNTYGLTPSTLFLSPHPERIAAKLNLSSQPVIIATLDLDALAKRCHEAFMQGNTCHHIDLTVSYLHTP